MDNQFIKYKEIAYKNWLEAKRKNLVDKQIIGIIEMINSIPYFYTTSSCYGRITLSITLPSSKKYDHQFLAKWHYIPSYEEFVNKINEWNGEKCLWLKFYSFILHVGVKDLEKAYELVRLAIESGLKESGIFEVKKRIMVWIEGVDKLELPLGCKKIMVNEDYLKFIYNVSIIRFLRNLKKIIIFTNNFIKKYKPKGFKSLDIDLSKIDKKIKEYEIQII